MFALFSLENELLRINLKCNAEKALEIRQEYVQVLPVYHINKKHWKTIVVENLALALIHQWIDESYHQYGKTSLSKKLKD